MTTQKKILIPLPSFDFDPSETGVPWKILTTSSMSVIFATPHGHVSCADQRMIDGNKLGLLKPLLCADSVAQHAYSEMIKSKEFNNPIKWSDIDTAQFDGLILPGGHAKGMKEYLESEILQTVTSQFFKLNKPVGAICHGVVLASRSKTQENKSVIYGRKTTSLLYTQEMLAWLMTGLWLKNYYRTYPESVESEVRRSLQNPNDFLSGPVPIFRDNLNKLNRGFVVQDKNYLSARWPGDAHLFALKFIEMVG